MFLLFQKFQYFFSELLTFPEVKRDLEFLDIYRYQENSFGVIMKYCSYKIWEETKF